MVDLNTDILTHSAPVTITDTAHKDDVRALISDFIASTLPEAGHPLEKPAAHHFARPGKMLRARLALSSAKAILLWFVWLHGSQCLQ